MAMTSRHGALVSCFVLVFVIYKFTHIQVTNAATMQGSSGFRMKLIPIYSDHSPLYPGNLTDKQWYTLILQSSHARSLRLSSTLNDSKKDVRANATAAYPDAITPKLTQALDSFYLVAVGIGSQNQRFFLHFDTGTDLSWVQCRECVNCFPVRFPNFRERSSTSLERVKCNTHECVPNICDALYNCEYMHEYGDRSTSIGLVIRDDFSFFSQDRGVQTIKGLLFGCGFNNNIRFGRNTGLNNPTGGMFGMSRGPYSFIHQIGQQGLGRFSYCLTHWTQGGSVSYLKFGAQASIPPTTNIVHTTPFKNLQGAAYFLNLLDIHLNGVPFGIPKSSLGLTLIDTGTPVTRPSVPVYEFLQLAVKVHFKRNDIPLQEYDASNNPNFQFLKFCFRKPSPNFDLFPKITFKFEGGADFTPTNRGAFVIFDDFFCMQIQDSPIAIPILGGFIQTDHIFVHDIRQERLSFARVADCNGL